MKDTQSAIKNTGIRQIPKKICFVFLIGIVTVFLITIVTKEFSTKETMTPLEKGYELTFGNPSYFVKSQGKEQANEWLETKTYQGVYMGDDVDWLALDELENRSVAYQMNGFKFVTPLLNVYLQTKEENYLEEVVKEMLSWIEVHPKPYEGSEWGWHDDGTARRVFYFTIALSLWEQRVENSTIESSILTDENFKKLITHLSEQVDLLTTDEFYTENHNHGMFQDQAVVLYALAFETGDEQKRLLDLAQTRVWNYFTHAITEDGVHKEHSPSYHIGIARNLDWFALAYEEISPKFVKELEALSDKMATFAMHLVMPNLYTASIGDSALQIRYYDTWLESNPYYRYVLSERKEGKQPKEVSVVFEEGGYGIMRSSWDDSPKEATWMLLNAATHSGVHKHNDDLNFLLYHKGELFVEAGSRNYDYTDSLTNYAYQSYGHNVILVDDVPFKMGITLPSIDDKALNTHITDYSFDGDVDSISAIQTRYKGIEQERTLSYDRNQGVVMVSDVVQTHKNETKLTFLYHLAEGVTVEKTNEGWLLKKNDETLAKVTVDGSSEVVLSEVFGMTGETLEKNPYQGIIFNGQSEPIETYLLKVDMVVPKGENTLDFQIELY